MKAPTRPLAALAATLALLVPARAQELVDPRPLVPAPALDTFDKDDDGDGIPDSWYNFRDARVVKGGVGDQAACLRFENTRPSRPARASRAFSLDGRQNEAIVVGLWVRLEDVRSGSRIGDDPALVIDFLDPGRLTLRHVSLGPWTNKTIGSQWTRVARRFTVPPGTRDAILSVGLLGATGVLEVDSLTIDLIPTGGSETTNLIRNGDFELGDPSPNAWVPQDGARRAFPGYHSASCLEFPRGKAKAMAGVAGPFEPGGELMIRLASWCKGLRESGGAEANLFFLDAEGELLKGGDEKAPAFRWSGSSDWQEERTTVRVPAGAASVVFQVETSDPTGILRVDDVTINAFPNPGAGAWTPDHVVDDTSRWRPYEAAAAVAPDSALDASGWIDAPAGGHGPVLVRDRHLAFAKGGTARFFGVDLLAPVAFQAPARADILVDRLARSGVNLVRIAELDTPLGPGRSLFDDTRDDTKALDPEAIARLDHLLAALKARGISYAIELNGARRFRVEDDVPSAGLLPPGGGPAAAFDPKIRARVIEAAEALLGHVNPETKLSLRDDPALAWITLAGELSAFDFTEDPDALPSGVDHGHRPNGRRAAASHRAGWKAAEAAQWKAEAEALRAFGLKTTPLAGNSHWRREPEFNAAQVAAGLDLIDDRLFWSPASWADPSHRSLLRDPATFVIDAARKRRPDRPYAVGQWCSHTDGAWALPFEGGDFLQVAQMARSEDWDALVRRGVFLYPVVWGENATGTAGGDDLFLIPESIGGNPQVFALLPHASSMVLRDRTSPRSTRPKAKAAARDRLVVETPHTQALAGWTAGRPAETETLRLQIDSPYGVVAVTAPGAEPIAQARRLLVTAVARVQPTGFRWADSLRLEVADPGRPPLLVEPLDAHVVWKRPGKIRAYALDNAGARIAPAPLLTTPQGASLDLGKRPSTLHWELTVE